MNRRSVYQLVPISGLIELWIRAYIRDDTSEMDMLSYIYKIRTGEDIMPQKLKIKFE